MNNIVIRNQPHEMSAEGSSGSKPWDENIKKQLHEKGYLANDIEISFDSFQGFWRWNCDIENIKDRYSQFTSTTEKGK